MESPGEEILGRLVSDRRDCLAALVTKPRTKQELTNQLPCSRSTVDRAITDLSDAQLVEYAGGKWRTTYVGACTYRQYEAYSGRLCDIAEAAPVLEALPDETTMEDVFVIGSSVYETNPSVPDGTLDPMFASVRDATRVRVVVPKVMIGLADRFYRNVATGETYALEVLSATHVLEQLRELEFERGTEAMEDSNVSLYHGRIPFSFGFWISDEMEVGVIVYTKTGIAGILVNDTDEAVDRAVTKYESVKVAAEPVPTRRESG
ncbi:helix-turn-helix transcriptional regulator [Halosolutus halophilus]|uniref:helix-turn-helix transcriptional regulator n=1 Tax=Halosolutus halophilus TaxID=1552990 RepID=UPI002235146F|nr:hypothetical protein [Halosolutus halophilus]